jgi:DUF4097 and DUF4098 domain-containing protein YvlB
VRRTITDPERITITEPVDRLEACLLAGRVTVVAAPGPCRVEVTRAGRPLRIDVEHGRLRIRDSDGPWWAMYLRWGGRDKQRTDITIAVPPHVHANLRVPEGVVTVSGLREQTYIYVTSGRIGLHGLRGKVFGKLVSGDVDALNVSGDLWFKTVSGDIAVAESSASKIFAKTISGTITCDLDEAPRGDLHLHTISGDITVRVPAESDLDVTMRTMSGRVTSSYASVTLKEPHFISRMAVGRLGSGSAKLAAFTTSGSLALLAQDPGTDE